MSFERWEAFLRQTLGDKYKPRKDHPETKEGEKESEPKKEKSRS